MKEDTENTDSPKVDPAKEKYLQKEGSDAENSVEMEKIPKDTSSLYKSAEVEVKLERHPNCIVHLQVTANEHLLKKAHEEGWKSVRKDVAVPGFRKGKAPRAYIEKNHADAIESRTQNSATNLAFRAALQLVQIPLLNDDTRVRCTVIAYTDDSATFAFEYETHPDLPSIDLGKYRKDPKVVRAEVEDREIQESIEQLRLFYAKWTTVIDRSVQEGDYVILDVRLAEEPDQTVFSDTRFSVSDKRMAVWMKKLVMGKKTGDVVEGPSFPDPDFTEAQKADFTPKNALVTIKKIETAELPELDESFARLAGVENLEELREHIEHMLSNQSEEHFLESQKEDINNFLIEHTFDMPRSLLMAEIKNRKKAALENRERAQEIEAMSPEEKNAWNEEIATKSEKAIRLFYLSREIMRKESLTVTEEEVQDEAIKTLRTFGPVQIDPSNISQELLALALSKVILEKVQKLVIARSQGVTPTTDATT
ncbi:MAG: trigger factor [Chlamydiota bacterium]